MRTIHAILLILVMSLIVLSACKSVETTSAMLHNEHGNYEKAIQMANQAIEKNPNDAEAYFQLGISYSYTGDMTLAYQNFTRAGQLNPKKLADVETNIKSNWAKHFNAGVAEFQSENLEGAATEFKLATDADPREVKGWLNLAKVYFQVSLDDTTYLEQTYASVDTLMAKTTKDDESYGAVLALAGKVMIKRGENEQAVEIFQNLMIDDPSNFEIVEEVGMTYLSSREWDNAVLFLEMASDGRIKTDSEDFELYYNLGVVNYNLNDYMKAVDYYQKALMLDPEHQQANYSLLLTYYQASFWDEAISAGQQYTEKYPDDSRGWQILGLSYREKGFKIKAEEAFQKYNELR
jgi:tetratricopeptide (TPR) repeat protein